MGWALVSCITAAVVTLRLWPSRWRPSRRGRLAIVLASAAVGAYLAVSLGHRAGFNAWLDDEVVDGLTKAEVDGTDVWLISTVAVLAVLGLARLWRRSG